MEFFFDPIDDHDRKQQALAHQDFYRDVTWACVYCAGEHTVETKNLPSDWPHSMEKTPSGFHYRVWCLDCERVSHGMPPRRFTSRGALPRELSKIKVGDTVVGWGVIALISPSSKGTGFTVTTESGFTFDTVIDVMMVMTTIFDD